MMTPFGRLFPANDGLPRAVWLSDEPLRAFIAFHKDRHNLFADDMREFLSAMDEYNAKAPAHKKVTLELRAETADFLANIVEGKVPPAPFGISSVQGFGLRVGRQVFDAHYFNDQVFNTGLNIYHREAPLSAPPLTRFLCGLELPHNFAEFVADLKAPSVKQRLFGWSAPKL